MQNQEKSVPKSFEKEYMRYYNKEIKRNELCKKFRISSGTIRNWRIKYGLPQVKKQFHGEIPENFKKEYMKYYNKEIDQSELRKKFRIGQSLMYKWRNRCNLPTARLRKEIPKNFEEEYMKYYNEGTELKELYKKFKISESLMYKWRNKCNLPLAHSKKKIPENFEVEYMKYYNREITYKELCRKLSINWYTLCKWRDELSLPKINITLKKEIPENFEEEYMKYYRREISCKELRNKLNIKEATLLKWRDEYNLPRVVSRQAEKEIPENFEKEYMRYYNKEIKRNELCKKFNVGNTLISKWRIRCNLPYIIVKKEQIEHLDFPFIEDFDDFIEY